MISLSQHGNMEQNTVTSYNKTSFNSPSILPCLFLAIFTGALYCLKERTAHQTPFGEGQWLEPLSQSEADSCCYCTNWVSGGAYVQKDRHWPPLVLLHTWRSSVEINHISHFFPAFTFHNPIVSVKRFCISVSCCVVERDFYVTDQTHKCTRMCKSVKYKKQLTQQSQAV